MIKVEHLKLEVKTLRSIQVKNYIYFFLLYFNFIDIESYVSEQVGTVELNGNSKMYFL